MNFQNLSEIKQDRCMTQKGLKLKYYINGKIPEKVICLEAIALFKSVTTGVITGVTDYKIVKTHEITLNSLEIMILVLRPFQL